MENVMKVAKVVLARLKQKTTWVGIIALLTSAGIVITPEMKEIVGGLGASIAGLLMILFDEDKAE